MYKYLNVGRCAHVHFLTYSEEKKTHKILLYISTYLLIFL